MLTAWAVVIAAATYFSLWRELIVYWLIPYTFIFSTLNYWSEVGDHYRVSGAKTRSDLNWFLNTFISHNIGYHALHHKYSSIPWFRLPEAYRAHKAEIVEQVSHGYWETFVQIIAYTPPLQDKFETRMPRAGRSRRWSGREDAISFPCDAVDTPAFIVRPGTIAASRDELARLCRLAGCRALYSLKALGLPDVLQLMVPQLAGFSASSLFEALLVRHVVGPASRGAGDLPGAAGSGLRGACPVLRRHILQLSFAGRPSRRLLLPQAHGSAHQPADLADRRPALQSMPQALEAR